MSEMVRNERFLSWDESCCYVGDESVLNETNDLFFRYAGFASVELGEKSYDRVHVSGFLRLYQSDVQELRNGIPVGCNSALINSYMAINGGFNEQLLEKFIVFDDELVIGVGGKGGGENALDYPLSIFFRESDLLKICDKFGLSPVGVESEPMQQSRKLERGTDLLCMVGALSCLLARQHGVDYTRDWHHLSDSFIDELFEVMGSLGIPTDGRNKFAFERLISEGVKRVNGHSQLTSSDGI
jgi:hypothetical protein